MYDDSINLEYQHDINRLMIKFISDYVMNSLHTGAPVKELVKEAKEAWKEVLAW